MDRFPKVEQLCGVKTPAQMESVGFWDSTSLEPTKKLWSS